MKKLKCLLSAGFVLAGISGLPAADGTKLNNSTALNAAGSWVDGNMPDASGWAIFNNTLTSQTSAAIGGNLSWGGIQFTNPANNYSITGTAGMILTLGALGIDMSSATADLTIGAVMDLSAAQTWTVAAGRTLTISGANIGAGAITLSGAGATFALGANTAISSGVLTAGPLGIGTVNLGDGIRLTSSAPASARTLYNAINLNGNIEIVSAAITANNGFYIRGGMNIGSANRTITVTNASGDSSIPSLYFGGGVGNTYSQVVGSGTLTFANGNLSASPVVRIRSHAGSSNDWTVFDTDVRIGNGVIFQAGGSNIFTVNTDMTVDSGGVLEFGNGSGSGGSTSIQSLSGGGIIRGNVTNSSESTLTINGGASTGTSTFSGAIVNGGGGTTPDPGNGPMAIAKEGSTTQIFTGNNTYSGGTAVNAGTLLINGTHIQAAATKYINSFTSSYHVAAGGVLGGTGRIAISSSVNSKNAVSVGSGGVLAPGTPAVSGGIGTLTLDGANFSGANSRVLNMASGAEFAFQLAGNGASADKVAFWNYVSGDLLLNANAINLTLAGPLVAGTYEVTLFQFFIDNGTTLSTSTGITTGLTIGTYDTDIFVGMPALSYNHTLGTITLNYTVIPEPSTVALLVLGGGAALLLRRRRC